MFLSSTNYAAWAEYSSLAWVTMSALASLGSNTGYSVAIGCFALYAALTEQPRSYSIAGGLTSLCLLVDVVYCSLHGGTLSNAGHEYGFALAMIIISMAPKVVFVFCSYQIMASSGYSAHSFTAYQASSRTAGSSSSSSSHGYNYDNIRGGGGNGPLTQDAELGADGYDDDSMRELAANTAPYQSSSATGAGGKKNAGPAY